MAYTIGYVYRAGTYCNGDCLTEALIAEGRLAPAARDLRTEDNLAMLAEAEALDALEMSDTDTFPQAVDSRLDDLMGQACEGCHGEIDPAPAYMGYREPNGVVYCLRHAAAHATRDALPVDDLIGQACEACHGEIDPAPPAYMGRNRAGEWVERCGCGSTEHRDDAPAAFHLPA